MLVCPQCEKFWEDAIDVSCCDCGYEIDLMQVYLGERVRKMKSLQQIQKEVAEWSLKTFGNNGENFSKERNIPCASWNALFGLVEEVGELSRTHICANQSRKGYDQTPEGIAKAHRDRIDACCDIMIFLSDYAAREGIDLQEELNHTWDTIVSKRTLANWEQHNHEPKEEPGMATVQPRGEHPITIGSDGLCSCSCADNCPLGKMGMEVRCTVQELTAAGITCFGSSATKAPELGDNILGYCPTCYAPVKMREKVLEGGVDVCEGGHAYPSKDSLKGKEWVRPGPSKTFEQLRTAGGTTGEGCGMPSLSQQTGQGFAEPLQVSDIPKIIPNEDRDSIEHKHCSKCGVSIHRNNPSGLCGSCFKP